MTEDGMVGWHHRLDGHEFKQTQGDGEGQESLVCHSPQGCKGLETTLATVQQQQKSGNCQLNFTGQSRHCDANFH